MNHADKTQMFGQRMMAARLRRALTQQELASRAHVSIRSIQVWERGGTNLPRPNLMRRLCAELGVLPEELLRDEGATVERNESIGPIPQWLAPLAARLERLEPSRREAFVESFVEIVDLVNSGESRPTSVSEPRSDADRTRVQRGAPHGPTESRPTNVTVLQQFMP